MTWTVETLNTTVDDELDALHDEMKARFVHISSLIEFVKKTEKTPVSEIKLAMQRAQEVLQ